MLSTSGSDSVSIEVSKRLKKLLMGWWKHHDKDMLRKHRDALYYPWENISYRDKTPIKNRYLGYITRQGIPHSAWQMMDSPDEYTFQYLSPKIKRKLQYDHTQLVKQRLKELLLLPANNTDDLNTLLDRLEVLLNDRILHKAAVKAKEEAQCSITGHKETFSLEKIRMHLMQLVDKCKKFKKNYCF